MASSNNGSLGIAKPMTESEKATVNIVIEDITDGRTEDGGKLWEIIRERIVTEDGALHYIAQFFRRQYNEGVTKKTSRVLLC